jgi:tetratricopeptide (TPR) repeat protein
MVEKGLPDPSPAPPAALDGRADTATVHTGRTYVDHQPGEDPGGAPAEGRPADGGGDRTANTVAGDARIAGPLVQARQISGGIHLHEHRHEAADTSPPARVPRQLIPAAAHFTGRAGDLSALDALRAAGLGRTPLVVVSGAAGVGKTALVATWLHQHAAAYPDGQLYADLRGHTDDEPVLAGTVLGRFLRALGMEQSPAEPAEQAALWRTVTADRRIVLFLDNAFSAAQIRPLLPASPGSLVAVTSRRRLPGLGVDGAAFHHLGALDPAAGVELLGSRLGRERVSREQEAAAHIARLCGGLPLAVCVAAARMAARPRQPLAALVAAMTPEGVRLSGLGLAGDRAVQAVLDESYGVLTRDAAGAYRRLGLLPVAEFGTGAAAAACALPADTAAELLDVLVEVSLLEELGPDRFRFHDLIRVHAGQRANVEDSSDDRAGALRGALEWYLWTATEAMALLSPTHRRLRRDYMRPPDGQPPFDGPAAALAWLDVERLPLMAALRSAAGHGWDDLAWQLVDSMQPLWVRLRPAGLWIEAHRLGLAAAARAGRRTATMRMLTTGGAGLCNAGRHEEAAEWFGRALRQARQSGDPRAEAQALHGLGQAHQLAGRAERATDCFRQALALREAIGHTRGAALSRLCLGDLALARNAPQEAVDLLTRARDDLLAVPDAYDAARALAFLGMARALRGGAGDMERGVDELQQARAEFAACGSVHWQARVLEMLGQAAAARGQEERARDWYEQSLARYTPVSPRDARRLEGRLTDLGHA